MNRIHYELEYTEGISQRMRIPETLMVAPEKQTGALPLQQSLAIHTTMMQVPERIVVAGEDSKDFRNYLFLIPTAIDLFVPLFTSSTGDDGDSLFSRPRDLDLIQSVPSVDLLNMKAPPRILTLTEQPLDSLETDQAASPQSNPTQAVRLDTDPNIYISMILYCYAILCIIKR